MPSMILVLCLAAVLGGAPGGGGSPSADERVQELFQTMHDVEVSIEPLPRPGEPPGDAEDRCPVGADVKISLREPWRQGVACWLPARDDDTRRTLCAAVTRGAPGSRIVSRCLGRRTPVCSRTPLDCSPRQVKRMPSELAPLAGLHARLPPHALPPAEVMALKALAFRASGRLAWRRPPSGAPSALMHVGRDSPFGFLLKDGRRYRFQDDPRYETAPLWVLDVTSLVGRPAHAFLSYTRQEEPEGSRGDVWLRILEFDEAAGARQLAVKKVGMWFGAGRERRQRIRGSPCAFMGCSRRRGLAGEAWLVPVMASSGQLELRLPRGMSWLGEGRARTGWRGDGGLKELRGEVGAWCWTGEELSRCPR
ncbi:hypothetical protein CYFUS_000059 [Cystobacter fuscus]|uniref:Uncharacterized protein n=1 Tax=Cystobacter fuscus TaxID=43 RepID=A0A250ITS8_9BACT|nr:hypothetical protein [Cystobacter fuscus]ATB34652.1 hypothetical protein CYFUS_000059 [Cystobacter fuscus]